MRYEIDVDEKYYQLTIGPNDNNTILIKVSSLGSLQEKITLSMAEAIELRDILTLVIRQPQPDIQDRIRDVGEHAPIWD